MLQPDLFLDRADPVMGAVTPPPTNKWLSVSAWHKSVRRGLADTAVRAAAAAYDLDPRYTLRRLPTLAFEEVGLAAPCASGR